MISHMDPEERCHVHVSKFIMRWYWIHPHCTTTLQVHIWNKFSDRINFFRFKSNFQIFKLNLRFQIYSNEFSRDRWFPCTFLPLPDILLTYFSAKLLYLDITSMTTSPVQFGRELWFGWTPVLITVPLGNFKDGGCKKQDFWPIIIIFKGKKIKKFCKNVCLSKIGHALQMFCLLNS